MSKRSALFLVGFGVWSWLIWPNFLRNIWSDPRSFDGGPTGFFVVHALLTAASLLFGTMIGVIGWRAWRRG
ncbi:SCO4848 family membrane protein [Actinokineospora globicatena]|uniref:Membrane protein n=1 Tax=Actinokineospora globicatena TaxID=103729 RepID=A0A9W6QUH7_9PSEU|nr:hypothetical protein [Actinokineospora globicatena]MCP2301988.1 hypothetical protein [Actinokineospora globicatena]GLW76350.1 membrane protein [Actinokineospora globicatena]GLW83186.1 membrane protein [Actinokineospora globicatena]GLW94844.1 membrane protein [Actinokineospora globicatena]